jgi:hypothetical protein
MRRLRSRSSSAVVASDEVRDGIGEGDRKVTAGTDAPARGRDTGGRASGADSGGSGGPSSLNGEAGPAVTVGEKAIDGLAVGEGGNGYEEEDCWRLCSRRTGDRCFGGEGTLYPRERLKDVLRGVGVRAGWSSVEPYPAGRDWSTAPGIGPELR